MWNLDDPKFANEIRMTYAAIAGNVPEFEAAVAAAGDAGGEDALMLTYRRPHLLQIAIRYSTADQIRAFLKSSRAEGDYVRGACHAHLAKRAAELALNKMGSVEQ